MKRRAPLRNACRSCHKNFPLERLGIEKPECAHRLDAGGQRYLLLFDQEQLIAANVLATELIGWFAEVTGKLGDDMQVNPGGGGRVVTDLEILQHPLS